MSVMSNVDPNAAIFVKAACLSAEDGEVSSVPAANPFLPTGLDWQEGFGDLDLQAMPKGWFFSDTPASASPGVSPTMGKVGEEEPVLPLRLHFPFPEDGLRDPVPPDALFGQLRLSPMAGALPLGVQGAYPVMSVPGANDNFGWPSISPNSGLGQPSCSGRV